MQINNHEFKMRPYQAFIPNEKMENKEYNRKKGILQASLAGKGAGAGQGKGGGAEKEKNWHK